MLLEVRKFLSNKKKSFGFLAVSLKVLTFAALLDQKPLK